MASEFSAMVMKPATVGDHRHRAAMICQAFFCSACVGVCIGRQLVVPQKPQIVDFIGEFFWHETWMAVSMVPNHFTRRFTAPGLLGSLLLCHAQVQAQAADAVQLVPNNQVLEAWQQTSPGAAHASLARTQEGATRLEWKIDGSAAVYVNTVQSAGGQINTPQRSGTFGRNVFQGDVRAIHADNSVDYFQAGMTHSNDLSVLSLGRYQVNNLQTGRTAPGFQLMLGDIAPNFSSLSTSQGVRGLYGSRQFGTVIASGFTGVVVESWEALANHVVPNQALKDVQGVKLEAALSSALTAYVTSQSSTERESAAPFYGLLSPRGHVRSASGGFQFQRDALAVSGEIAGSRFADSDGAQRHGHASIVDASWRFDSVGLRAGYHDLSAGFTSLSLAAQPGVREAYAGLDWTAASWLRLSTDLRRSRATTLATADFAATFVRTDSLASRASINFGPDHPAWSLALQQSVSRSADQDSVGSGNTDLSTTLNYATPRWTAAWSAGTGQITSELYPEGDSRARRWSLALGRVFSDAGSDHPASWTLRANLQATSQTQRLSGGGETREKRATFTLNGLRAGWGSINLLASTSSMSRPLGGPNLRQSSVQLDATYAMVGESSAKVYWQNTLRNLGDVLLASSERSLGVQLNYRF